MSFFYDDSFSSRFEFVSLFMTGATSWLSFSLIAVLWSAVLEVFISASLVTSSEAMTYAF